MGGYIKTDKALVKLKSIYIGDGSSKAKKIKKAYMGDSDNKARLIWSGGNGGLESLSYIGTARYSLSASRAYMGAASNNNLLFFAGGTTNEDDYGTVTCTSIVDAYNENLTLSNPARMTARTKMGSASINGNAVFAGGQTQGRGRFTNVVESYNNLGQLISNDKGLSTARGNLTGGATESFAYFGGGHYMRGSDYICVGDVDVYDDNLTYVNTDRFEGYTNSRRARSYVTSVSTPDYVLFAGGRYFEYETEPGDPHEWLYRDNVDVFDDSGQHLTPFNLRESRSGIAGACAGEYIILRGGYSNSGDPYYTEYYYNAAEIIDSKLTLIDAGLPGRYVCESAGTSLGKCAIFAGGFGRIGDDGGFEEYPDIDAIDEESVSSLIESGSSKTGYFSLSEARSSMAAGTIGNYALFAGGIISDEGYSKIVDVVKLE